MLVVSINDMEPLCVWGHHLHQVADVVIEAAYCLLGFQKNANLPTLPQSGTCPQRFHPAMRGLLIRAVMSIKRAITLHVEEAGQRQSDAGADAGDSQLQGVVRHRID
jgi:hypothetical protein